MPRNASKRDKIPIGTVLVDKYRIAREIGRGGMAAIYEAVNVDIGKKVAVKVLNPEFTHSTVVVERFFREARAAASVKSPYICDVYDAGKLDNDRPFLVLELLRGESLYERMVKVRKFKPEEIVKIFHDVCRGLDRAHAANIIHRDLKPENIFLSQNEEGQEIAKILDFGLAKFYAPVSGTEKQQRLTREGAVFGTPAYMSPEQVRGQGQIDHRADLWSVGCIVYETLTGRTVWDTSQGVAMIFAQIATKSLPKPSEKNPILPSSFDDWFNKALTREPEGRFQTAGEMWEALEQALRPQPHLVLAEELTPVPSTPSSVKPDSASIPESGPPSTIPSSGHPTQDQDANEVTQQSLPPSSVRSTPEASADEQMLSTAASPLSPPPPNQSRGKLLGAVGVLVILVAGVAVWNLTLSSSQSTKNTSSARASAPLSASAPPSSSASATPPVRPSSMASRNKTREIPEWERQLRKAQRHLHQGKPDEASRLLREAVNSSANTTAQVMLEDLKLARKFEGACKLNALGRPRPLDLKDGIRSPVITRTSRGVVAAWVDNHETTGQWHVYTQVLDDALVNLGSPVDVTPETSFASMPKLYPRPEHLLMLYSDARGTHRGAYVRRLSTDGRISGPPILVNPKHSQATSPTLAVSPLGDYWVCYDVDPDKAPAARLFLQHISPNIRVTGKPTLVAEYASTHGLHRSRLETPSAAFSGNTLQLVYKIKLGQQAAIIRQSLVADDRGMFQSLKSDDKPTKDRIVGEKATISDRAKRLSGPSVSCEATGCFVAWKSISRGLSLAYVDSTAGTTIWKKMFARKGTSVSVRIAKGGHGLLVWYQAGRVHVAPISRDGIGESSVLGRVTGDQLPPTISPGLSAGHWLVAWTDYEAGHLEAYVARAVCSR